MLAGRGSRIGEKQETGLILSTETIRPPSWFDGGMIPHSGPGAERIPLTSRYSPQTVAAMYLAIALLFAAIGWSGLWSSFSLLPRPLSSWWTLATAVPASALVLLRERAPFVGLCLAATILAADLLTFGGVVPLLVVLELLHAVTVALAPERRRRMLHVVVAATVFVIVISFVITRDLRATLMIGVQIGALLGISYWYANSVAQARELVQLHRQRAEDAARLAELDRAAAVQGERDRMARELHDVVAGHISAVAIRSEAALNMPGEESLERRSLRAVRDASLEAHATLRSMIQVLRSGGEGLPSAPGRARLAELVAAANASGVRATLIDPLAEELPPPVDQAVGRIVQEALANAVRHASGAEVEVRLAESLGDVTVEVHSRGGSSLARPALQGSGMGLDLLAERTRTLGGEFEAVSREGAWIVRAVLPKETP